MRHINLSILYPVHACYINSIQLNETGALANKYQSHSGLITNKTFYHTSYNKYKNTKLIVLQTVLNQLLVAVFQKLTSLVWNTHLPKNIQRQNI